MSDRTFEFLLNAMERASQSKEPAKNGYAEKREAVLAYVRGLEFIRSQVHAIQLSPRTPTPETTDGR